MADTVAFAVLENLVHMSRQDFPSGYVVVCATIPDDVEIHVPEDAPGERSLDPHQIGDLWLTTKASAVLRVPSVIVPSEFNYLLNPDHEDFDRIITGLPSPFTFDERLFQPIYW